MYSLKEKLLKSPSPPILEPSPFLKPYSEEPGACSEMPRFLCGSDDDESDSEARNSPDLQQSFDGPFTQTDIIHKFASVRQRYHSWTYASSWGPETLWMDGFTIELNSAQGRGPKAVGQLFRGFEDHAIHGRGMLRELKGVGHMSQRVRDDSWLVRDFFLQSFDLLSCIISEVKFVEIKVYKHQHVVHLH